MGVDFKNVDFRSQSLFILNSIMKVYLLLSSNNKQDSDTQTKEEGRRRKAISNETLCKIMIIRDSKAPAWTMDVIECP